MNSLCPEARNANKGTHRKLTGRHLGLIEGGEAGYPSSWTATIRTPFTYIYSLIRQFYREDKGIYRHIKKLKRQGTDAKTIGQAMLKHQGQEATGAPLSRLEVGLLVLFAIVTAVGGLLGCVAYWQIETYTLISDLDFPRTKILQHPHHEVARISTRNQPMELYRRRRRQNLDELLALHRQMQASHVRGMGTQGLTYTKTTSMLMIPEAIAAGGRVHIPR